MDRDEYNNQAETKAKDLLDTLPMDHAGYNMLVQLVEQLEDAADMLYTQADIDNTIDEIVTAHNLSCEIHAQIPLRTREAYNNALLQVAIDWDATSTEDGDEHDEEMLAQIQLVREMRDSGLPNAWDSAVDHLREMLTISYLSDTELIPATSRSEQWTFTGHAPYVAPTAPEAPATPARLISITGQMTPAQAEALRLAAEAIINTTPEDDEATVFQLLLDALDRAQGR